MIDNYADKLPEGWTGGEAITKWWRGKHVHLYRLQKPCAQCGTPMVVDVTKDALQGNAKNSGLLLKRCVGCRNASKHDAGRSRPHSVSSGIAAPPITADEVERITDMEAELKEAQDSAAAVATQAAGIRKAVHEELGLSLIGDAINYNSVKAAIQALKAKYELGPALKQFDPHKMLAEIAGPTNRLFSGANKMPWE